MPRRSLAPLLSLVMAIGCYRYVPATSAPLAVGAEVRLELTPAGARSLAPVIGQDVVALSGRILSMEDRQVAMSVTRSLRQGGAEVSWSGERVSIPTEAIQSTSRRVIDRKRTTLASVMALLGAGLIGAILQSVSTKGNPGGGTSGPPPA